MAHKSVRLAGFALMLLATASCKLEVKDEREQMRWDVAINVDCKGPCEIDVKDKRGAGKSRSEEGQEITLPAKVMP